MIDIKVFGAKGDGRSKDTAIIQAAIDELSTNGGGRILFPAGTYLTGTLYLKDNVTLDLESGAKILGSPDKTDYNADDFCSQNRVFASEAVSGAHLIVAVEANNIAIVGQGCIDGNREAFYNEQWDEHPDVFKLKEWRPAQMIFFVECKNVTISGVKLYNSCYWTCFLHGCEDVAVSDLRIWNDRRTPNGDGLDIDCCRRVTVTNCNIDVGDDCITLRGSSAPLKDPTRVCEYVTVTNCVLRTRCNAFRIGVGNGIVRNCAISNIVVWGTRTAICLVSKYSATSEGVQIENVQFDNLNLDCVRPFYIASNVCGVFEEKGKFIRNISFSDIHARACQSSLILGNSERQIKDISFSDIKLYCVGGKDNELAPGYHHYSEWGKEKSAPYGFYVENADGVSFQDVSMNTDNADKDTWLAPVFTGN